MTISLEPIATIHTPYKEKFAIPRQPGLATSAKGYVDFHAPFNDANMLRGIDQFSHLWLTFIFHANQEQGWKPLVRPPRLGGNEKLGVFATRSTFRPNHLGMSVVKNEGIHKVKQESGVKHQLMVSGMDLLDGTPIVDIKPYVPYSDSIPQAQAGFAQNAPDNTLAVTYSDQARSHLLTWQQQYPELEPLLEQILSQDPRPAFHNDEREYGMALFDLNIRWKVGNQGVQVLSIQAANIK